MNQEKDWIEIGTIVAPQGLDGEMRVYPDSDFPERFLVPGKRWLRHPKTGEIETTELLGGRYLPGKNLYIITLKGIRYRDRAEALRDYKLLVLGSDLPELEEDEFHVRDLINLEVYNQQTGEIIGIVSDLFNAGNDLLEITLHKQPEAENTAEEEVTEVDMSKISRRSKRRKFKQKKAKVKSATILVPFVMEIVPIVDIKNKRIEINPPEGLIDS